MKFTKEQAEEAARKMGLDLSGETFTLDELLDGMNAELRHGKKAADTNVTDDDPTMTAKLAVANLRVSPSYYSGRVGRSAWERSLAKGVQHKGRKTEYKTIDFELEEYDEEEGIFSGYASVFGNVDSGGDVMEPGAFTKTIAEGVGRVKILSGHNEALLPIGKPLDLREDARGLFIRAKISDTALGRDVKTLIRDKVLCELSIGYDPVVFDYDETGIRHLREVKLWEVSVVTWAMNEAAVITDFKQEATARVRAMAEDVSEDIKAGRKISAARLKSLEDASSAMKAAVKALDKIISEARDADTGKGEKDPAQERKNTTPHRKAPQASKARENQIVEIVFTHGG